jgi:hypothetical protein
MERKGCTCWLWMVERAAVFVDGVEHGMAHADGGAAPTVAGKEVVGAQPSGLGVVVQIPLDAQVVDGLEAQPRGDRREVARRGEEGDGAQVQRGVEDVAPVGNERAAEVGIDEELLRNLPTGPLAGLRRAAAAGTASASAAHRAGSPAGRR